MNTQQAKILQILQLRGVRGVNSWDLTYTHGVKQAPTRIKELKEKGYVIHSRPEKNRSVTYILLSENKTAKRKVKENDEYVWIYEGNMARQVLKSEINRQEVLF